MARWENEDWKVETPKLDKVVCKNCVFREKDRYYKDKLVCEGATLGTCKVYPMTKPAGILFDGDDCEYHTEEDDG